MSKIGGMRVTALFVSLWLVVIAGCNVMSEASKLLGLQIALSQEFHEPGVAVQPTPDGSLTILFPNSKNATLPEEERAAFARRVAEFVRDRYTRYAKLQAVQVGFQERSGMTVDSTEIPYRFTVAELGPPVPRPAPPKP